MKRRSCFGNREASPKSMKSLSSKENGGADGGTVKAKLTLLVCLDDGSGISSIRRGNGGDGVYDVCLSSGSSVLGGFCGGGSSNVPRSEAFSRILSRTLLPSDGVKW